MSCVAATTAEALPFIAPGLKLAGDDTVYAAFRE